MPCVDTGVSIGYHVNPGKPDPTVENRDTPTGAGNVQVGKIDPVRTEQAETTNNGRVAVTGYRDPVPGEIEILVTGPQSLDLERRSRFKCFLQRVAVVAVNHAHPAESVCRRQDQARGK
jgi:hypothetical protein